MCLVLCLIFSNGLLSTTNVILHCWNAVWFCACKFQPLELHQLNVIFQKFWKLIFTVSDRHFTNTIIISYQKNNCFNCAEENMMQDLVWATKINSMVIIIVLVHYWNWIFNRMISKNPRKRNWRKSGHSSNRRKLAFSIKKQIWREDSLCS